MENKLSPGYNDMGSFLDFRSAFIMGLPFVPEDSLQDPHAALLSLAQGLYHLCICTS